MPGGRCPGQVSSVDVSQGRDAHRTFKQMKVLHRCGEAMEVLGCTLLPQRCQQQGPSCRADLHP